MDSVQEVHFDNVLRNGVLETVKHLAPIAQRHVLLVQLGTEQTHSCSEVQNASPSQLTLCSTFKKEEALGQMGSFCQVLVCQHSLRGPGNKDETFSLNPAQSSLVPTPWGGLRGTRIGN